LGSTGLEAEWNEDVHQAIYSNLFGFKDVPLPAKQFGKLTSQAIPSVVTSAPVVPPKEVAPVAAAAQPTIEVVPQEPIITPSPVVAVPEVEILPIPKPFEEALNQPIVPEEKPVSSTPEPNVVIVSEDKPKPAATENVAPVPGPAQKAVDNFRKKEERKKRKFPWAITLIVLLLILLAGLWFVLPQKSTEPVAPAAVEVPNAEIPKAEVPAPPIEEPIEIPASQPGYHLIVASSSKEADVLKEAEYWKSQGMTTEVIPPDTLTDFYRLSVLHSTQRGEVVAKMIELKDETYSWILERN